MPTFSLAYGSFKTRKVSSNHSSREHIFMNLLTPPIGQNMLYRDIE